MDDKALIQSFDPLYRDITEESQFYNKKPLLAHYTSLFALEKILESQEIWFSNPLFMNDLEEVRFGMVIGAQSLKESKHIREALGSDTRHVMFIDALDHYINDFEQKYLLDTYIFCLSEHAPGNEDGLLSMWRGYGSNGNGAAIVFDTSKLDNREEGPMILAQVDYGTKDERIAWLEALAKICAEVIQKISIPDDKIYIAAYALFQRLKLFALFTKHRGFREEHEWRVVYMSERDTEKKFASMFHYFNGPRGVEPKLRFKIQPMDGITDPNLSLNKIVSSILLGPTTSSPLAVRSVKRMLDLIGASDLKDRLVASSIPFRVT